MQKQLANKKKSVEAANSDLELQFIYQDSVGTFGQKQKPGIARVLLIQKSTGFYRSANNLEWVLKATPEMMYQEAVSNFQ